MTEDERNQIWCAQQKARRRAQRQVEPFDLDSSDWKGMVMGLALAIGGVAVVTGILWLIL